MENQPQPHSLPDNNNGINDFKTEIQEPAKPAVDTPVQETAASPSQGAPQFSEEPLKQRPIFDQPQPEPQPEQPKVPTDKEARETTELFLTARSILQAEVLAMIAESKNPSEWEYSPEQIDKLARVWAPYIKRWGNLIPDWVWLALVEGMTTGKMLVRSFKEGNTVRRNAKMANTEAVKGTVAKAAAQQPAGGVRKRWTLKKDGTYKYDRNGEYVKLDDPKEKADITDLKTLLEYNNVDLVCQVFGIDRAYIADQGITLDEE